MVLSYLEQVNDGSRDLRAILSQNIRVARDALHLTQAKLAEYADISMSYMADIEYCRTWVSDKTLINIARALNMEAYQLLVPGESGDSPADDRETRLLRRITELIAVKKGEMRKAAETAMDDLAFDIITLYSAQEPVERDAS
jgi:transcriptional regulator with XRE-family HTH domain